MILDRYPGLEASSGGQERAIGYWCSRDEPDLPDPHDFVDPSWAPQERDTVGAYLALGDVFAEWMGFSWCRFEEDHREEECKNVPLGTRCLTDGTYVWPEGFSHYLYAHAVRPPEEFVQHVLQKGKLRDPVYLTQQASELLASGEAAKARPLFEQALQLSNRLHGDRHPDTTIYLVNYAGVLHALGESDPASQLLDEVLYVIAVNVYGPEHADIVPALTRLGLALRDKGQSAKSHQLLDRTLDVTEAIFGASHPTTATALENLAAALSDLGRFEEALRHLQRALAIEERTHGLKHPALVLPLSDLAAVLMSSHRFVEARPLLERALAIAEKTLPDDDPLRACLAANLACLGSPK